MVIILSSVFLVQWHVLPLMLLWKYLSWCPKHNKAKLEFIVCCYKVASLFYHSPNCLRKESGCHSCLVSCISMQLPNSATFTCYIPLRCVSFNLLPYHSPLYDKHFSYLKCFSRLLTTSDFIILLSWNNFLSK